MYEPKHILKDTMYKPSEPLSDEDEGSNFNTPIFGRRNMEDYFYESGTKKKDDEDNEYSGIFYANALHYWYSSTFNNTYLI